MSSRKGGAFERAIAVQLSEWWSTGLGKKSRQDIFWRTAGSGARATVRTKRTQRTRGQYGDICAIDPLGAPLIDVLTIELKNGYSSHTIANLLDCPLISKQQQYEEWFFKLHKSHQAAGSLSWALIHKRTRREPLIFLPYETWQAMWVTDTLIPLTELKLRCWIRGEKKTRDELISGLQFSEFLELISPKQIVALSKM